MKKLLEIFFTSIFSWWKPSGLRKEFHLIVHTKIAKSKTSLNFFSHMKPFVWRLFNDLISSQEVHYHPPAPTLG